MPAEGNPPFGLDSLDIEIECLPLVRRLQLGNFGINRSRPDFSCDVQSSDERAIERYAKPSPKLLRVGDRVPNPFQWRVQNDVLFNFVWRHEQLRGCSSRSTRDMEAQLFSCAWAGVPPNDGHAVTRPARPRCARSGYWQFSFSAARRRRHSQG